MLAFQFGPILIAQDGQKKLVAHGRLERLPIDVEIFGVLRGVAVFQHVLPPDGVVTHPHVVGNDVEQQAQTLPLQLRRETGKAFVSPQFRIEAVVTGHIIPVHAAGPGFKDGRGIEVADAQLLEVAHDGLGVGKVEVLVHLHPVGRNRNPGVGVQYPLDAFPHVVGGFLARVGFRWGQFRHGFARGWGSWLVTDILHWMRSSGVEEQQSARPDSAGRFTNSRPARKMEYRLYCNEEEPCHFPAKPSE